MANVLQHRRLAVACLICLGLSGCDLVRSAAGFVGSETTSPRGSNTITINGTRFTSKLNTGGPENRDLTITVRPVRVDPNAAQEAARYRATVYCLRSFGSSATDWTVGPDIPVDQIRIVNDSTTLAGKCAAR